jgi:hypothetical protein
VRALDQEVNRVSAALTAGVTRYEQAQDRLARLTQARMSARDDVEAREADAATSRASFGGLARSAYKGGVPPLVTALLSGDPRTVSDLAYVQRSVAALGVERNAQAWRAEERRAAAAPRSSGPTRTAAAVGLQQAVDASSLRCWRRRTGSARAWPRRPTRWSPRGRRRRRPPARSPRRRPRRARGPVPPPRALRRPRASSPRPRAPWSWRRRWTGHAERRARSARRTAS